MAVIKTYKKMATIDAVQWEETFASTDSIQDWALRYGVDLDVVVRWNPETKQNEHKLLIPTLEGPMYASIGDYIAKGINDEFWAIKPDIMAKTYEEV